MQLAEIEQALADGRVFALVTNGRKARYWRVRRNGRTQTWKTRPGEFRIPVVAGLNVYGEITHRSRFGPGGDFKIVPY
jgi:hypothetical protein